MSAAAVASPGNASAGYAAGTGAAGRWYSGIRLMQPLAPSSAARPSDVSARRIVSSLMTTSSGNRRSLRRRAIRFVRVQLALALAALEQLAHRDEEHRHEQHREHDRGD